MCELGLCKIDDAQLHGKVDDERLPMGGVFDRLRCRFTASFSKLAARFDTILVRQQKY
jgi:hypothetical protein